MTEDPNKHEREFAKKIHERDAKHPNNRLGDDDSGPWTSIYDDDGNLIEED